MTVDPLDVDDRHFIETNDEADLNLRLLNAAILRSGVSKVCIPLEKSSFGCIPVINSTLRL